MLKHNRVYSLFPANKNMYAQQILAYLKLNIKLMVGYFESESEYIEESHSRA